MAKQVIARVVIPTSIEDRLKLAKKVYGKHVADGAASIISHVDGLNWATTGPTIDAVLALHEEAEELKRQMEKKYEARNLLLQPIDDDLALSTKNIKAAFAVNPKKMADYGYDVDDSPKKVTPKK